MRCSGPVPVSSEEGQKCPMGSSLMRISTVCPWTDCDGGCQRKGEQRVQLCPTPTSGVVPVQPGALLGLTRSAPCSPAPGCSTATVGHWFPAAGWEKLM